MKRNPISRAVRGASRHPLQYFYLETDGQVFLIKNGSRWTFPTRRSQIPCAFTPIRTIPLSEGTVVFAKPKLARHPSHWFHKDDIVGNDDIAPVVKKAINRSLVRTAAKVVVVERGRVLMVKASRGYTKGFWNLPGGFMGYGEHPEESARREVKEEIGVSLTSLKLLGIYSAVFPKNGGHMISFAYKAELAGRRPIRFKPDPDEIDAIGWIPITRAIRETPNLFCQKALRDYLKLYK